MGSDPQPEFLGSVADFNSYEKEKRTFQMLVAVSVQHHLRLSHLLLIMMLMGSYAHLHMSLQWKHLGEQPH